jgi:hypothetical protein
VDVEEQQDLRTAPGLVRASGNSGALRLSQLATACSICSSGGESA